MTAICTGSRGMPRRLTGRPDAVERRDAALPGCEPPVRTTPVLSAVPIGPAVPGVSPRPVGGREAFVGGRDDAPVGGLVLGHSSSMPSTWPRRFDSVCIFSSSASSCCASVSPPCLRTLFSVSFDIIAVYTLRVPLPPSKGKDYSHISNLDIYILPFILARVPPIPRELT